MATTIATSRRQTTLDGESLIAHPPQSLSATIRNHEGGGKRMINGDKLKSLSLVDKLRYFPQCLLHHREGEGFVMPIRTVPLCPDLDKPCRRGQTPSRILCESLYDRLGFGRISKGLGGKVHFLDIGCGNGRHGTILESLSGDSFGSYTGLDVYRHRSFPERYSHILDDAANASRHMGDTINFVFSQSALEHIEKDTETLVGVTRRLLQGGKPFIQLHMIPAASTLWLYLWHGWRQYSYRNLCSLGNNLAGLGSLNIYAIPLGGARSFFTHLFSITCRGRILPTRLEDNTAVWYDRKGIQKKVNDAVMSENHSMPSPFTNFWGLVITSENIALTEGTFGRGQPNESTNATESYGHRKQRPARKWGHQDTGHYTNTCNQIKDRNA